MYETSTGNIVPDGRPTGIQQESQIMIGRKAHCNNVYISAKPLIRMSQLLGLAPVKWPDLKPSAYGIIYTSVMLIALLAWYIYTTSLSITNEYPGKVTTFIVPDLLNSSALYFTSIISLLLCIITRYKPETIMQLIYQVDEVLLPGPSISVHNKMNLVVITQLLILIVVLTILSIYDNWVWTKRFWNFHDYTGRFVAHLINGVLVLQFSNLALMLKHRFTCLNKLLQATIPVFRDSEAWIKKNTLNSKKSALHFNTTSHTMENVSMKTSLTRRDTLFGSPTLKPIKSSPSAGMLSGSVCPPSKSDDASFHQDQEIFSLRKAHATLCEVASSVNSMFGIQILLEMTSEFIGIVWLLYLLLVSTVETEFTETSKHRTIQFVLVLLFRCLKILIIVGSCHAAQTEARHTGTLVHQVLLQEEALYGIGRSSNIQLQLFSQQLLHSRYQVNFTACGFFPLDMTVLHSIVGAVTTYIIILMQFHNK